MNSSTIHSGTVHSGTVHSRTPWRSRRAAILAAVAAFTITASTLAVSPAHAEGVDAAAVEQTLRTAGAVRDVAPVQSNAQSKLAQPDAATSAQRPAVTSTARLSLATGLSVATGANTLSITPVVEKSAAAASGKALSPSGLAVFANTRDSSFAFSKASTGGNAGYAVITGPNAPTVYRFAFAVDGKPAVLRAIEDGGIEVLTASGTVVNSVAPAWAKDATGAALPTSYSVSGNILTQNVTHAGAVYPVVADPRVRCDSLWCTAELTRADTQKAAAGTFPPAALCAWFGTAGKICSAMFLAAWAQANIALSTGQCIGFRIWKANFVSYPHIAYIPCYA